MRLGKSCRNTNWTWQERSCLQSSRTKLQTFQKILGTSQESSSSLQPRLRALDVFLDNKKLNSQTILNAFCLEDPLFQGIHFISRSSKLAFTSRTTFYMLSFKEAKAILKLLNSASIKTFFFLSRWKIV